MSDRLLLAAMANRGSGKTEKYAVTAAQVPMPTIKAGYAGTIAAGTSAVCTCGGRAYTRDVTTFAVVGGGWTEGVWSGPLLLSTDPEQVKYDGYSYSASYVVNGYTFYRSNTQSFMYQSSVAEGYDFGSCGGSDAEMEAFCRNIIAEAFDFPSGSGVTADKNAVTQNFQSLADAIALNQSAAEYGAGKLGCKQYTDTVVAATSFKFPLTGVCSVPPAGGSSSVGATMLYIGTGSAAPAKTDTTLTNIAVDGTGWAIGPTARSTPVYDSTAKQWKTTLTRKFANNTGAAVAIREIGLYHNPTSSDNAAMCLLTRSVLPTAVTIADGSDATFSVTLCMEEG